MRFFTDCGLIKHRPCLGSLKRLPTLKGCGQSCGQAAFPWVFAAKTAGRLLGKKNASGARGKKESGDVPCGKKTTPRPWFFLTAPAQSTFTPGGCTLLDSDAYYPAYANE